MRQLLYRLGLVDHPLSYKTRLADLEGQVPGLIDNAVKNEKANLNNLKIELDVATKEIGKLRKENEALFAGEKPKTVKITRGRNKKVQPKTTK